MQRLGLAAVLAVALAGCSTSAGQNPGGGVIGAAAAGAMVSGGGVASGPAGAGLDAAAQKSAGEAEYRALEYGRTGVPVSWTSGAAKGEVVPGASYKVNASDCRDYTHSVTVGGKSQSGRGTACRQPSGVWQAVT